MQNMFRKYFSLYALGYYFGYIAALQEVKRRNQKIEELHNQHRDLN